MALDPAALRFLEAVRDIPQPYEMALAEFRRAGEDLVRTSEPEPITKVDEFIIPGGDGQELRLRCYVPAHEGPRPVVVWLHGGSFIRGSLDMFDAIRRSFANGTGCIVLAVDQRLSPEAQFPAPLEDAYAAIRWAADNADSLGGDPNRLGVGGESSGGNLATAVTLLARKRGAPRLAFQVLVTPLVDATVGSVSAREYGEGYVLTRQQLIWAYEQYAPGVSRVDPLLSPLHEPRLDGLPPAVVLTVEYDPVRDEGELYARRLAAEGVPVSSARIDGFLHHFPGSQAVPTLVRLTCGLLELLE
ncbi:Alpha/beta hydrolase fold-3 domain protein [Parafrankia sp. EAN1pec]|uniref:alpha/beta hydrolase n=1 Tax=Parafrankia sp. (strain EAN1pec) TaxID=298653 RepID=UPI000054196D|nr:Alpha/beta hydrolase fold-3 domain protein [Frankia sp. EAN1pec]